MIVLYFSGFPDSGRNLLGSSFAESNSNHGSSSCFLPDIHNLVTNTLSMPDQELYVGRPTAADFIAHNEAQLRRHDVSDVVTSGDKLISDLDVLSGGESPHKLIQVCYSQSTRHLHFVTCTVLDDIES